MSDTSFAAIRTRLDQIAEEVAAEGISLDDALALYEEAVKLGLQACNLSEEEALAEAALQEVEADEQRQTIDLKSSDS